MKAPKKPKLAVFKLASCDGCQLSLLDCEDELLALAGAVEIAHFLEASSRVLPGPYDVTLVEGSVTTAHDRERIRQIRASSKLLVTIGACATSGGIQALRNFARVEDYARAVYAHPEYLETLETSTGVAEHVTVDHELFGCPVDKQQLLELLTALLHGRPPNVPHYPVCIDCKRRGVVCVWVSRGETCLGPVTKTGCGALCPRYARGCFGCFGPAERTNADALVQTLLERGKSRREVSDAFASFNAAAPEFARQHHPPEQKS
ncbi:MAG: oxidoreductase [Polyangiaceae bacterium]